MHLPTTATLLLALLPTAFSLPNARPEPQTNLIDALLGDLTGQGTPPLMTTNPSPECVAANGGELTCCGSVVDGGNALVQTLAKLAGYTLTKNTINGLFCKFCFLVTILVWLGWVQRLYFLCICFGLRG